MDNGIYALVLTGDVLPGHAEETVWPALAKYFRMEPDKLRTRFIARAPIAIKQGDDLGKLQTLQAGIAAVGAEAEICAPDERPNLFVVLGDSARGPVPAVFVDDRVERGLWPARLSVADVGSNEWRTFAAAAPPAAVVAEPVPEFDPNASRGRDSAHSYKPTSQADAGHRLAAVAAPTAGAPQRLPAGEAIHAGFWRRCAAMIIDGVLVGIVVAAVQAALGLGVLGAGLSGMSTDPAGGLMAMVGAVLLLSALAFVGQWLYFALFESGPAQATPGKMALGIQVTDEHGGRIGFGRASGRWFGKIVSGMVFYVGFLMAGFGSHKQALHDMMANTFVVFDTVAPGQPMPTVRPPMPWYGWLANILGIGLPLLAVAALVMLGAELAHLH